MTTKNEYGPIWCEDCMQSIYNEQELKKARQRCYYIQGPRGRRKNEIWDDRYSRLCYAEDALNDLNITLQMVRDSQTEHFADAHAEAK